MKRTLISILLVVFFVIPNLSPMARAERTYSDTTGHWAEAAIERWSNLGVLLGSDGKFRPNDPISRAELAAIINRIMKFPAVEENFFNDAAGKWYESDVNALAMQSIYLTEKGQAFGSQPLTREEAIEMLHRAFLRGGTVSLKGTPSPFTDRGEVSPEYADAVNKFRELRFINGFEDGTFRPKGQFTRAQVVTILDNMIGMYITEPGVYDVPDGTNVCVAVPDVTLKGKAINYLCVLPAANEGMTIIEQQPACGIIWGKHNYRDPDHFRCGKIHVDTLNHYRIRTDIDRGFAGGTGRNGDPYVIETAEQLRKLDNYLSEDYKFYHFLLKKDITLSGSWTPIGFQAGINSDSVKNADMFWGTFDGDGHAINDVSINYKGNEYTLFGFFSFLSGVVKNLDISGTIIAETDNTYKPDNTTFINAGLISGILGMTGSLIDNCNINIISSVIWPGIINCGGVVGVVQNGNVENCTVTGKISVQCDSLKQSHDANAGGIVGASGSGISKINKCSSDADVTATGGYYSHAGGIIGACKSLCSARNCFSTGSVHAEGSAYQNNAGGIVGQMESTSSALSECASFSTVSASGNPGYFNAVGGIAGTAYTNSILTNCYSAGAITVDGPAVVGGLVGRAECRIRNSYTVTKITAPLSLGNFTLNGLNGPIRKFIVVSNCGVFNVAQPHFITYDEAKDIYDLTPLNGRSPSNVSTYKDLSSGWNFDTIWTFASSGDYSYPILQTIPEALQIGGRN